MKPESMGSIMRIKGITLPKTPLRRMMRRGERGSTILLVITILSLLVLLALTMTFTSRLELSASRNYSVGVQNRMAALTGVGSVAFVLNEEIPAGPLGPTDLTDIERSVVPHVSTSPNAPAASMTTGDSADDQVVAVDVDRKRFSRIGASMVQADTAYVTVEDAAARININAASEEVLAKFFNLTANKAGMKVNGEAIAAAIVDTRFGPDREPGAAGVDDDLDAKEAEMLRPTMDETIGLSDRTARAMQKTIVQDTLDAIRTPEWEFSEEETTLRSATRKRLIEGIDEYDEYIMDLRHPAYGDDIRFGSLGDLMMHPAIVEAGLTNELLELSKPFLTVMSVSIDQRIVDNEPKPLLDINRASAEEIYEALKELYGEDGKNLTLLKQYAANIVDARDFDHIPTVFGGSTGQSTTILGVERTPYIIEVYPDSISPEDENDEGEFVELHNPWPEQISVEGWKLTGPGMLVRLTGVIAPNGYLVVTDDLDNYSDDEDDYVPGTGSLYDIFNVIPDGYVRRGISQKGLSIPSTGKLITLTLEDDNGDLIDQFTYTTVRGDEDSLYSYQRENPLVRESLRQRATPFALSPRTEQPDVVTLDRLLSYPPDGPFVSTVDLLSVFAGFADPEGKTSTRWNFPVVASTTSATQTARSLARNASTIDARVIDVFSVEYRDYKNAQYDLNEAELESAMEASSEEKTRSLPTILHEAKDELDDVEYATFFANWKDAIRPGVRYGQINLNTASEEVIASLPGIDEKAAARVAERREKLIDKVTEGKASTALLYRNYSDVLVDDELFATTQSAIERLQDFRAIFPLIALNTRSFVLVGEPRIDPGLDRSVQTALRIEALVSVDRFAPEVIYWRHDH